MPSDPAVRRARYAAEKAVREAERDAKFEASMAYGDDAVGTIAWIEDHCVVPPGGPCAGNLFVLPDFQQRFLRDCIDSDATTACLSTARKSGKSGLCSALVCAALWGNLNVPNFRIICASVSLNNSDELKLAVTETAKASGFEYDEKRNVVVGMRGARVEFISPRNSTNSQSLNANIVLVDELGDLDEKYRSFLNNCYYALSARAETCRFSGKLLAISTFGHSRLFSEIYEDSSSDVAFHLYQSDLDNDDITDEANWELSNPGLDHIKSRAYMRKQAARAKRNPANLTDFLVYELNHPGSVATTPICSVYDWQAIARRPQPPREGTAILGIDLSYGTRSMSAWALLFENGRLETHAQFPAEPSLRSRGLADGCGNRYIEMERRGELTTQTGRRSIDVQRFVEACAQSVGDAEISIVVGDRWKEDTLLDAIRDCGLPWRFKPRGVAWKDATPDIASFQSAVVERLLYPGGGLLMPSAIEGSNLVSDASANMKLDKSKDSARIDPLSASVLAVGEWMRRRQRPKPRVVVHEAIHA